jgi:glycine cleavage system H protein
MANYPSNLRYTNEHEWVLADGGRWRVGVTDFAAKQLGDVVMVDLQRKVGDTIAQEDAIGTIESVKAVSEIYAPISGKIVAVNEQLTKDPELINTDPYGDGWIVEIEPSNRAELDALMAADAYTKLTAEAE